MRSTSWRFEKRFCLRPFWRSDLSGLYASLRAQSGDILLADQLSRAVTIAASYGILKFVDRPLSAMRTACAKRRLLRLAKDTRRDWLPHRHGVARRSFRAGVDRPNPESASPHRPTRISCFKGYEVKMSINPMQTICCCSCELSSPHHCEPNLRMSFLSSEASFVRAPWR